MKKQHAEQIAEKIYEMAMALDGRSFYETIGDTAKTLIHDKLAVRLKAELVTLLQSHE